MQVQSMRVLRHPKGNSLHKNVTW